MRKIFQEWHQGDGVPEAVTEREVVDEAPGSVALRTFGSGRGGNW
jgi:hypothetical protein